MVITSYTFLYPFGYHCNRLCNSTATSLTVVLQQAQQQYQNPYAVMQHLCSILYLMSFDKYLIPIFQSSSEKIDSSSIRNFSSLT